MSNLKSSLKDDQDFNIWFVKEIEKLPCLYNHNDPNYTNKQKQDEAWYNFASQTGGSVLECKERWKNLRACFTRHLKQKLFEIKTGIKMKKPYYLAEHLSFLLPFTKLRSQPPDSMKYFNEKVKPIDETDTIYVDADDADYEFRYEYEPGMSSQDNIFESPEHSTLTEYGNAEMKLKVEEHDSSSGNFKRKRFSEEDSKRPQDEEDADLNFLKSLLPDMKEMSSSQKRKFKIQVLKTVEQILDSPAGIK